MPSLDGSSWIRAQPVRAFEFSSLKIFALFLTFKKRIRADFFGGAASAAPERGEPRLAGGAYLFKNSSKLRINRAQKEIGRVGAGRARPRGQRRRGFGQGKFEPEKKKK